MARKRNPEDPKKTKGLPHESENLLKASELFERGYNTIRAELGPQSEIIPAEEIESDILEEQEELLIQKKRRGELAQLKAPIDFTRHFENVASFKLDLEAFLMYLKAKIKEETAEGKQAKEVFEQYRIILRRIKELVNALKGL